MVNKKIFFSRSILKLIFLKKYKYNYFFKKKIISSRSSNIPFNLKNSFFFIWKGLFFNKLFLNNLKFSLKFGSFSSTRRPFVKPLKKK